MLYVVMEKGDTDLATFFKKRGQNRLDYLTLAFYWSEMLKAVQVVHQKGIVHSDLKPRNFLIVGGQVKLIDFGIANAVPSNKTSVTKECQMGTPNYMSPEALSSFEDVDRCKFRVGVKSDVWSLGCILYYMVYGKTPFEHVPNNCKMFAITNCKYQIEFEPIEDLNLLNVMQRCLERDPRKRASVEELLNHTYLKKYSHGSMVNARSLSDEKIKDLALLASKNTPKTNAKLLKYDMEEAEQSPFIG
uniref:Protein kinase domain-containing protein n=1 Tax=Romanomermis culicivorax TaxID=13658 RepID=A0A915KSV7_ROMCU